MTRSTPLCALLLIATLAGSAGPAAADTCNPNAWFIGVVSDVERGSGAPREDFEVDVDNFAAFKAQLQQTYCFADTHAKILAFKNGYSRAGVSYDQATEGALRETIARFGAEASAAPDPMLFFFLSSHGIAYPNRVCPGGRRVGGSLSALQPSRGHDGDLYDCELGDDLNRAFPASTRMIVMADCSLCGGFSDSLTAVSGTVPDGSAPTPSGIVAPNRVVVTGCAVTTECFGSDDGGILYKHLLRTMSVQACDGFTAPGFPAAQGVDAPVRDHLLARDGRCDASEWFHAAVDSAYRARDVLGIQEQFRLKYGFATLAEDLAIV